MLAMLQISSYSDIQCHDGNDTSTESCSSPVRKSDSADTAPYALGTWLQKIKHKQTYKRL